MNQLQQRLRTPATTVFLLQPLMELSEALLRLILTMEQHLLKLVLLVLISLALTNTRMISQALTF